MIKFQGRCFNCGKKGHKSTECRLPMKKNPKARMVEAIAKDVSAINLLAVVFEVNLVGSNPKEWWIDTRTTHHVCSNWDLFTSFKLVNGEKIYMANSVTSAVEGQGKVVLKMTSEKLLTLNNVLYDLEIRKNLLLGSVMNKHGFKMVFQSDKVISSKSGMYVGKGYKCNGFFKLNVMTIVNKNNATSIYLLESTDLWHGRLGHVNYDSIWKLVNMEHNLACRINYKHKCKVCAEAKLTRNSFQTIERNTT